MAQQDDPRTSPREAGQTVAPASGPSGRGLAHVIEQLGQQLAELRRASLERESIIVQMTERESSLVIAREDLDKRLERAAAAEQELAARAQAVEAARAEIAQRGQHLQREVATVDEQRKRLEDGLAQAESDRAAWESQCAERERRLAGQQAEIVQQRQQLGEQASSLVAREHAAEQAVARAQRAEEELQRVGAKAADLERQITDLRRSSEQATAIATQAASAAAQAAAKAAEKAEQELHQAAGTIADLQQQLASIQQTSALQAAKAEDDLRQAIAMAADLEKQLTERDQRMTQLEAQSKAEEERLASSVQSLAQQLAEATASMNSERTSMEAKRGEATDAVKKLGAAAQRIADLSRLADDREAKIVELKSRLDSLTQQIESAGDAAGETANLSRQLTDANERLASQAEQISDLQAHLAEAAESSSNHDEIDHLHDAIAKLKQENARLAARPTGPRTVVPEQVGQAVAQRWGRLRLLRKLIGEQQEKLAQAGDALRQRFEQCDQILAQREQLARARAELGHGQKKLERLQTRASRGRAAALVFYLTGTALALAALSWGVAGSIVQSPYAARAVLAAETKGLSVTEGQVAEWQAFQEAQLADPATIEMIAERMARRGIASLATPGQVQDRLKRDFVHQSAQPGQLVLELRGEGAGPTTRALDTIVTALASQANATKERRPDGLGTILAEPANTNTGPISDQRPLYAAATFLVSFGLSILVGALAWRRMATAKVKLEEAEDVDRVLEATLKHADAWKTNRAA
ncbi:MAG: hypothetical protein ACKVW3_03990 [Phycisphaerales bacterium]